VTCTGARSAGRRPALGHGVPAEGRHWGTECPAVGRHGLHGLHWGRPKAGTGLHWGHVGVPCCRPKAGAGWAEGPALRRAQCARGAVSSALCTARGSAVCAPYIYYYIYCYNIRILRYIYMNIRERPRIYYSMRTIPIELAYALCLVSPWMHNRSVTRAGATSSYKLQLVADGSGLLVVAILWALMLEIGTSVTTADVHPEVLVDDLLHRQAEEVELPIIMVEDVRGQFIVAQLEGLVAHLGSTCQA